MGNRNRNGKSLNFFRLLMLLPLAAVLWACSPSEESAGGFGEEYYPIETGAFITYDVQEINHRFPSGRHDTVHYLLRETVADTFIDAAGGTSYKLVRETQDDNDSTWKIDSVWAVRRNGNSIVKTESNRPQVKLVFPLKSGQVWNGNMLIDSAATQEEYWEMKSLGKPLVIANKSFPKTAIIEQRDENNCRLRKTGYEYFAQGIGLIYKEQVSLQYKETEVLCDGPLIIEIGTERRYYYKEHGKN
ncbi:MAG: hypothetical protein V4543_15065 [Bacteroidota bacterium]